MLDKHLFRPQYKWMQNLINLLYTNNEQFKNEIKNSIHNSIINKIFRKKLTKEVQYLYT